MRCEGMSYMDWNRITRNWNRASQRLQDRFPETDPDILSAPPPDLDHVARHVAERHDLTYAEALVEVQDLFFAESLPEPVRQKVA